MTVCSTYLLCFSASSGFPSLVGLWCVPRPYLPLTPPHLVLFRPHWITLSEDVHRSQLEECLLFCSYSPHLEVAELHKACQDVLGGRVKQLVKRQSVHKHRCSMGRGINFRVITSQDSENGSVILITDTHPLRNRSIRDHAPPLRGFEIHDMPSRS